VYDLIVAVEGAISAMQMQARPTFNLIFDF
jgi:hypothetical protein